MKLTTALFFIIISFNGLCDTIDVWNVYVNDKLVAEFNVFSTDLVVAVKKSELKENDVITVRYGNDTPCFDCSYMLAVFAEFKRKVPEAETKEHYGKMSIPFKELFDIQKTDGINSFSFNYYVKTKDGEYSDSKLLFTLKITN